VKEKRVSLDAIARAIVVQARPTEPTQRQVQIEKISARRLAQGEGIDQQYERLNAARDKRWRRRKRNVKLALEHGSIITLVGGS
jgi:hypothetical protein